MLLLLFLLSLSVFLYAFLSLRPKGPVKEGRPSIVGLFGAVGWNFSLQVFAAQTQTGKEKGLAECQSSFLPEKQQNSSISHPSQDTQAGSVSTVISSSTPRKRAHQCNIEHHWHGHHLRHVVNPYKPFSHYRFGSTLQPRGWSFLLL